MTDKDWSVALVHGIPGVIPVMDQLAREACPGVTVFHLLHEGLFLELSQAGYTTPSIIRRLCRLVAEAEESSASVVLVTGSTFSPAVDVARRLVAVPVLKIDEAMAETVVARGDKIGLVATEETTVEPSSEILRVKAREQGKAIDIVTAVCPQARILLREGRVAEHDALVREEVEELDGRVDLIVLAQVSMYSALDQARQAVKTPVYGTPELAVAKLRRLLMEMGWSPAI